MFYRQIIPLGHISDVYFCHFKVKKLCVAVWFMLCVFMTLSLPNALPIFICEIEINHFGECELIWVAEYLLRAIVTGIQPCTFFFHGKRPLHFIALKLRHLWCLAIITLLDLINSLQNSCLCGWHPSMFIIVKNNP